MSGISSLAGITPGDAYTTDGKDVWIVKSMCHSPTITLINPITGAELGGAVGCANLSRFVKLIPADAIEEVVDPKAYAYPSPAV